MNDDYQTNGDDKLNAFGVQEIEAPRLPDEALRLPDEWPAAEAYPLMAGFSALKGFTYAETLKSRRCLEQGYDPVHIDGKFQGLLKLSPSIRGIVRKFATIRQRLGDRASRVVARTMGDHFIKGCRTFVTTESGAGFGMYRCVADLRAKNCLYQLINTYALSWHEAALAQDYLEAVITQQPGRHNWLCLPTPHHSEAQQKCLLEGLLDEQGNLISYETNGQMEARRAYFGNLPPMPPEDPDEQVTAFLKEHCEEGTENCGNGNAPGEPLSRNGIRAETDAADLMASLMDWSIARGFLTPSRKFVGQYMSDKRILKRESNGHTYYALRWKASVQDNGF